MKQFLLILILNTFCVFSQQKDVFTIAKNGSIEEIKELLLTNSNVLESLNEHGFSPLILSCYKGNNEIAEFIINQKVDLNYVSQEGTALMAATVKGNIKLVDLLLKGNANPNLTNENATTALMYAIQFKNIEIIKLLLINKADKTILDKDGKSAFEYAIFSKDENIINLLK
ncbi:ankyrin repeat domain-containing protein [Flavobacterium sp.]|uniref:ankyrin repeat domain-containing protein n=1 Tax=Flavobacterium sp. TaxID=239 RepID=UPI003751999C